MVPPRPGGLNLRWLVLPPLFFWESAGSALQVAHRALWPWARVAPAAMTYRPRARSPTSTMALSWVISALPGTLVGDLGDRDLSIHVLDQRQPVTRDIGRMERYIAWAMRERWDEPGEGAPCKPS
jgi:multisubunit Na+/H+ antiporter MnhE subunit